MGGASPEASTPVLTPLPGTLRTLETLFTQQPLKRPGPPHLIYSEPRQPSGTEGGSGQQQKQIPQIKTKPWREERGAQPKSWSSANVYSLV